MNCRGSSISYFQKILLDRILSASLPTHIKSPYQYDLRVTWAIIMWQPATVVWSYVDQWQHSIVCPCAELFTTSKTEKTCITAHLWLDKISVQLCTPVTLTPLGRVALYSTLLTTTCCSVSKLCIPPTHSVFINFTLCEIREYHSGVAECSNFLGCYAVSTGEYLMTFWSIVVPLFSMSKSPRKYCDPSTCR